MANPSLDGAFWQSVAQYRPSIDAHSNELRYFAVNVTFGAGLGSLRWYQGATPKAPCCMPVRAAGSLTVLLARSNTPPAEAPTSQKKGRRPLVTALFTTYWW